jgi:DNA primase
MQISNYRKDQQEQKDAIPLPLPPMPQQAVQDLRPVQQERHIIKLLLQYGHQEWEPERPVAAFIFSELEEIEFEDADCRKIAENYTEMYNNGILPETAHFLNIEDAQLQQTIINLLEERYTLNEKWGERTGRVILTPSQNYRNEIRSALLHLKLRKIQQIILENQKQLKDAADEDVEVLLLVKKELQNMKKQITDEIGNVVL